MLTLLSEVKFLTTRDDINIKDTDFGVFKLVFFHFSQDFPFFVHFNILINILKFYTTRIAQIQDFHRNSKSSIVRIMINNSPHNSLGTMTKNP